MTDNLYNDKDFQDGVKGCLDELYHFTVTAPIPITTPEEIQAHVQGRHFCLTLLQSLYDSLTEETPYVNPFECDCGRHSEEPVTMSTGGDMVFVEVEPDDKPIIINSPRYSLDYEGAEY